MSSDTLLNFCNPSLSGRRTCVWRDLCLQTGDPMHNNLLVKSAQSAASNADVPLKLQCRPKSLPRAAVMGIIQELPAGDSCLCDLPLTVAARKTLPSPVLFYVQNSEFDLDSPSGYTALMAQSRLYSAHGEDSLQAVANNKVPTRLNYIASYLRSVRCACAPAASSPSAD